MAVDLVKTVSLVEYDGHIAQWMQDADLVPDGEAGAQAITELYESVVERVASGDMKSYCDRVITECLDAWVNDIQDLTKREIFALVLDWDIEETATLETGNIRYLAVCLVRKAGREFLRRAVRRETWGEGYFLTPAPGATDREVEEIAELLAPTGWPQ